MFIYKSKTLGRDDYEGYTPPSRARCGSRNPEAPELKDHCFCSGVGQQSSMYLNTLIHVDIVKQQQ
jgi:hypothetical protein